MNLRLRNARYDECFCIKVLGAILCREHACCVAVREQKTLARSVGHVVLRKDLSDVKAHERKIEARARGMLSNCISDIG